MIADIEHRQGSLCQIHGHNWQATSQQAKYQCFICQIVAYCPACLQIIPVGVLTIRCEQHKEQDKTMSVQQPDRRQYQRPQPPDMRNDGTPVVQVLRTSQARQVNTAAGRDTEPVTTRRSWVGRGVRAHWLPLLAGVLVVLVVLIGWLEVVSPWWNGMQDQWHYGDARITQMDANVGHGGTSHFIAEYYQGKIVVIELSLTNQHDSHVYTLAGMVGATETPVVLLSVQDVNHDGKPDLVIQIEGTSFAITLYNTGTGFSESEG